MENRGLAKMLEEKLKEYDLPENTAAEAVAWLSDHVLIAKYLCYPDAMTEEEIRQRNEERRAKLDAVSRRNMEKCAAFIARMIEKYGREVLAEIEEEERQAAAKQEEGSSVTN